MTSSLADCMGTLGGLRLESGRPWAEVAHAFQVADARAILEVGARARLHFLTRPRGGSKTTDLAAISLIALIEQAPQGSSSYAAAADADQAGLLIDAVRGFVLRNPSLASVLKVEARRIVATTTGAALNVLPADSASAYGLRPWLTVIDELSVWPSTSNSLGMWEALISAVPKVPQSRLVVLTTAGDPAHFSRKILNRARVSPRWRVNEVPGPTPWISEDDLEEQRGLLSESQYQRLVLNRWTASEDRLVRDEDLAACVTLDGPLEARPGTRYVIGVDLGLRHDRTAVAVCHAENVEDTDSRRVVLDRLIVLKGSREREVQLADVESAIAEASRVYNRAEVRLDPWQAIGLKQRLSARGVSVEEYPFSSQSVGRLAATLHLLLRDRLLALPDDEELIDELANVRLRETGPGVLRIDHDPGRHDDRAIALALAATALVEIGKPGKSIVQSPAQFDLSVPPQGSFTDQYGNPMSGDLPRIAGRR